MTDRLHAERAHEADESRPDHNADRLRLAAQAAPRAAASKLRLGRRRPAATRPGFVLELFLPLASGHQKWPTAGLLVDAGRACAGAGKPLPRRGGVHRWTIGDRRPAPVVRANCPPLRKTLFNRSPRPRPRNPLFMRLCRRCGSLFRHRDQAVLTRPLAGYAEATATGARAISARAADTRAAVSQTGRLRCVTAPSTSRTCRAREGAGHRDLGVGAARSSRPARS